MSNLDDLLKFFIKRTAYFPKEKKPQIISFRIIKKPSIETSTSENEHRALELN
jgi:hypothetical protein